MITLSDVPKYDQDDLKWIDQLIKLQITKNWEVNDEPEHLKTIRDRLLSNRRQIKYFLGLYRQILGSRRKVIADGSPGQDELCLSGLVIKEQGFLKPRNRVYKTVFSKNWTNKVLSSLNTFDALLVDWFASGCKDDSKLLTGKDLDTAIQWAKDTARLTSEEMKFLLASQQKNFEQYKDELDEQRRTNKQLKGELDAEKRSKKALNSKLDQVKANLDIEKKDNRILHDRLEQGKLTLSDERKSKKALYGKLEQEKAILKIARSNLEKKLESIKFTRGALTVMLVWLMSQLLFQAKVGSWEIGILAIILFFLLSASKTSPPLPELSDNQKAIEPEKQTKP